MSLMSSKPIDAPTEVAGIWFRPLRDEDLDMTLSWRNRDGVRQRFGQTDVILIAAHRSWYASYARKHDDLVLLATEGRSGPAYGQLAIYEIDPVARRAEVGRFVVAPEHAAQGKMRRAIMALLVLARVHLQLREIVLRVREDNERAIRLYASLGFAEHARNAGMIEMSLTLREEAE